MWLNRCFKGSVWYWEYLSIYLDLVNSVVLWVELINSQFCWNCVSLHHLLVLNFCLKTWGLVSGLIIVFYQGRQGASNHVQSVIVSCSTLVQILCPLHKNKIYIKTRCKGVGTSLWFPRVQSWGKWFNDMRVSIFFDQYLEYSIVPRDRFVCIITVSILVDVWLPCLCNIDPPWFPIHCPQICVDLIITLLWCDSVIVYYQLVFELVVINLLNVTDPPRLRFQFIAH